MARTGRPRTDAVLRFIRFIALESNERGCWLWTGALDKDGYGWFSYGGRGRHVRAARWALESFLGRALLPGMTADHLCFEPWCVRPGHLEEVPMLVNLQRRRHLVGA